MNRNSFIQKTFLTAGAIGWGIAVLGVLLPWNWIAPMLQSMGATYDFSDRQVQYWLRMACGGWSVIGFLFLMVLLFPLNLAICSFKLTMSQSRNAQRTTLPLVNSALKYPSFPSLRMANHKLQH